MRKLTLLTMVTALCSLAQVAFADIPEGYYSATKGKKKAELKAAMHSIIRTASVLDYGKGKGKTWYGFYTTDQDANGYCIDRYSPQRRKFKGQGAVVDGMNIEHSFAKSWWGGTKNQAYKDLFNLMPSDSCANSAKSNYPMGKVTDKPKYNNGSIKVGHGDEYGGYIWEPEDKWKGDFARTYMYMVTCYSDFKWEGNALNQLNQNQWPTFNTWTTELLLKWSREDPVDEIELKRNEEVYKIQGNRNPFVDYPYLSEYIWGDSIDYAFNPDKTSTTPGTPDPNPDTDPEIKPGEDIILVNEAMTANLGIFADVLPNGQKGSLWRSDSKFGAVANAFKGAPQAADNYLVATIDLTDCDDATLTFVHQTGFNKTTPVKDTFFSILVSTDYHGVPQNATWNNLDAHFPALPTATWTQETKSGDVSLKQYAGQTICLAFRYQSNTSNCFGWEIRNVKVVGKQKTVGIEDIEDNQMPNDNDRAYDLTGRPVKWSEAKGAVIVRGKLYIK